MNTKILLYALVFLLTTVLVWVLFVWEPSETPEPADPQSKQAFGLASRPTGGDFTLVGSEGPVALADFRGKVVVIYFGYSYCPDVCLTSLGLIAQGLSALDEETLKNVQGLFISVDPERDTPQRLAEYAPFFHTRLLGVTGTTQQIADLARMYGSSYRKNPKADDGSYSIDHSSITYIVAPDGKLVDMLQHGTPAEKISAAIRKALAAH